MMHACTISTDLDELIGTETWEDKELMFHYGPLAQAMKCGEELVLENSGVLSAFMIAKLGLLLDKLFIDDTSEVIQPHAGFRLTLR